MHDANKCAKKNADTKMFKFARFLLSLSSIKIQVNLVLTLIKKEQINSKINNYKIDWKIEKHCQEKIFNKLQASFLRIRWS